MEVEEAGARPGAGGAEEDDQEGRAVEAMPREKECEDKVCDDEAVNGQIMRESWTQVGVLRTCV